MSARLVALSLLLAAGLGACAPADTAGNAGAPGIGMAAPIGYGTIIGMAPAQVQAPPTGAGALAGGLAGGMIGSAIGGDWRARTVGLVGGWVIGAGLGAAAESGLGRRPAVSFVIRPEDGGPDYLVVQTNEQVLQVGERVAVSFGDRARLQRVATTPDPDAAPPRTATAAPGMAWKN
jgi:outer membrane lipoprotein SlyB